MLETESLKKLLARYELAPCDLFAEGTEALVFKVNADSLLKVYADASVRDERLRLKLLLDSIAQSKDSFYVPKIKEVHTFEDVTYCIEEYVNGTPMTATTNNFDAYLSVASSISSLPFSYAATHFSLFNHSPVSAIKGSNWYRYFLEVVQSAVTRNHTLLKKHVPNLNEQVDTLTSLFGVVVYEEPLALIHGDMFPGNILVDVDNSPLALIDFGTFTMFGDPLYDLATATIFFDMYGEERFKVRETLIAKALRLIRPEQQDLFFGYILGCAFISHDLYPDEQPLEENGHFQWALEILNSFPLS